MPWKYQAVIPGTIQQNASSSGAVQALGLFCPCLQFCWSSRRSLSSVVWVFKPKKELDISQSLRIPQENLILCYLTLTCCLCVPILHNPKKCSQIFIGRLDAKSIPHLVVVTVRPKRSTHWHFGMQNLSLVKRLNPPEGRVLEPWLRSKLDPCVVVICLSDMSQGRNVHESKYH